MPQSARNLLSGEASPYLRQHAENPVHWRPWGEAALDEARQTGKPILLSVGYAACHWCHVMAHESFEDPAVADVMNRLFVNIKVDREERPDIDQIYMAALTAMGEQGGWPLTMFLTPEGEPFWGGTYFPKQQQYGRPGFVDVLNAVHRIFEQEKSKVAENVSALHSHLAKQLASSANRSAVDPALADGVAARIAAMVDPENGGLNGAPKFPNAPFMEALWLSWLRTRNESHRDAFIATLRGILNGGIYDHLGGGMARYSVDERWLVPHFEKMLYDNAQMIRHALWAHHATDEALFRIRIEETVDWLAREMRLPSGAFAASLDADSEGEEGRFYVWTPEEIEAVLGADAPHFCQHYDVTAAGNWEGKTILNRLRSPYPTDAETEDRLARMRTRLLTERDKRVRPGRDDKALTDWNGLAIRALAEAGRAFERADWIRLAQEAYRSVAESKQGQRLPHSVVDQAVQFPGLASDYAAMINAALSLYAATWDTAYVADARASAEALQRWHGLGVDGFSLSASDCRDVILHIRGDQDDATPSATAQIIEAMTRLAMTTGDETMRLRAIELAEFAIGRSMNKSFGQVGIINSATLAIDPWKLAIVAASTESPLVSEANRFPDPRRSDVIAMPGNAPVTLAGDTTANMDKEAAWLCRGQTCLLPVDDADALRALLAGRNP